MSIEEAVIERLRFLPEAQKQEVLDFVDFLAVRKKQKKLKKTAPKLLGRYANLKVALEERDLLEARKQMWGQFPREIEL
ncbi:MAG: DUF2281 domain-containing protein [Caldilineaceae bacterium]